MKVLVIGGGGREHALVWKLKQSAAVTNIWCAPGNGGIANDAQCIAADLAKPAELADLAKRIEADLTVVGPELPLVAGIADEFARRKLPLIGPSRSAAQLEGSKVFAKQFMQRHNIPTARLYGCYDRFADAEQALSGADWPLVIKADGLCAGKGVLVAGTPQEARDFLERLMVKVEFGEGGRRVILEKAIAGQELSLIVLTDGEHIVPMVPARDHKRVFDGDKGPNTGGMGAYSTDDLLSVELAGQIRESIIRPAIDGMAREGNVYRGFLYFGLMLTEQGAQVLEFNCRMGDPETQAIVLRMDFDLAEVLAECAAGRLDPNAVRWKAGASTCVVMTAEGYPGNYRKGAEIAGLDQAAALPSVAVFHSGTRRENNVYYTTGGRVLGVAAHGPTLDAAASRCYDAVRRISFAGEHHRKDIGRAASAFGAL
jgi:phosphoribosylamine---glycine ligase